MDLVVGVAILRDEQLLAARRTSGRWEFPGGKVEPGESPEAAAVREVAEELGCDVEVREWLAGTVPVNERLELRVALADLIGGEPSANGRDHDEVRWLPLDQIAEVDWLPADLPFVAELTARGVDDAD